MKICIYIFQSAYQRTKLSGKKVLRKSESNVRQIVVHRRVRSLLIEESMSRQFRGWKITIEDAIFQTDVDQPFRVHATIQNKI